MTKKTCFIIQPFSEPYENRFDIVYKPAIEHADLIPYRAGGPEAEVITEDIEDGIRNAHICFADITENNPNVWYEVGFAYACGKSVVMVCNKAVRSGKELPFDISVKNVILYEDVVDSNRSKRDRFKQKITEQFKARVKKADSDSNTLPIVAQQSQNDDNLTALEGKILKVIFRHCSMRHNRPMILGNIVAEFPDARRDALDFIDKLALNKYIKAVPSLLNGEEVVRYRPTEKGRRWYHDNKDN